MRYIYNKAMNSRSFIFKKILPAFSFLVFLFAVGLWGTGHLAERPGFHFDEAWAAQFSHRIAFEPGFWPWTAMSAYTSPWTHYWTALFFKWSEPSVLVYRLSYFFWAWGALALFAVCLWRLLGKVSAALAFLALAGTSPALVLNHRFAIELTTFLPFCAAGFFLSYLFLKERPRLATAGIVSFLVLGTTSHIMFLAFPLALFLTVAFSQTKVTESQRKFFMGLALCFLLFFIRTLYGTTWASKSYALITATLLFGLWIWDGAPLWHFFRQARGRILKLASVLFVIFLFNFLVFQNGEWGTLYQKGDVLQAWPYRVAFFLNLLLWARGIRRAVYSAREKLFFFFLIICLGALMITPAPRYFEIAFMLFTAALIRPWLLLPRTLRWSLLTVMVGMQVWAVQVNLQTPHYDDRDFRFFTLKDSSYDFIPKDGAQNFLHAQGCSLNVLRTHDVRTEAVFRALSVFESPQLKRSCQIEDTLFWERKKHLASDPPGKIIWQDATSYIEARKL